MKRYRGIVLLVGVVALTVAVIGIGRKTADAQTGYLSFDLVDPLTEPIPPFCTTWDELYPEPSILWHQEDYQDNGDGVISVCDNITLTDPTGLPMTFHICWVGPTYFLSRPEVPDPLVLEPQGDEPPTGENPICEIWGPIPDGPGYHVDGWQDNGDGLVSECDFVHFEGEGPDIWWHLDRISLDILVSPPGGPSASEKSTWGWIKSLFN
jgi:hypothetical protein